MANKVLFNNSSTLSQAIGSSAVGGTLYFPTDSTSIVLNGKQYGKCACTSVFESNVIGYLNPEYTTHLLNLTEASTTQGFRSTPKEGEVHTIIVTNAASSGTTPVITFDSNSLGLTSGGGLYSSGSAVNKAVGTSMSITVTTVMIIRLIIAGGNAYLTVD